MDCAKGTRGDAMHHRDHNGLIRTLRRASVLVAACAASALLVTPTALASPANHLTPSVTCVEIAPGGAATAHFGYANTWTNKVTVPAGKTPPGQQNWFLPSPADRGQPSQFQPGSIDDVFTVTFTPTIANPTLEWRLADVNDEYNSAIASVDSRRCAPVPAAGLDSPWPVALAAVALGALVARHGSRAPERAR